jgi:hypothetical protein
MAQSNRRLSGKTPYRQALNLIGGLVFERGFRNDLDVAISYRRVGEVTMITVIHSDGVMNFVISDSEIERELTPRQLEARRLSHGESID